VRVLPLKKGPKLGISHRNVPESGFALLERRARKKRNKCRRPSAVSYAGFLLARSDTQGSQKPVYPRNSVENPEMSTHKQFHTPFSGDPVAGTHYSSTTGWFDHFTQHRLRGSASFSADLPISLPFRSRAGKNQVRLQQTSTRTHLELPQREIFRI